MPTHKQARRLADAFEKAYPKTLPTRLAWWCRVLDIPRPRFLRLLGLSADEADSRANQSWDAILAEKKEWEDNGWLLEGRPGGLLALFDYDWQALAAWLHQIPQVNGPGSDSLHNQLAEGGPQAFAALLASLTGESPSRVRSS
jgi:hypothetical protein